MLSSVAGGILQHFVQQHRQNPADARPAGAEPLEIGARDGEIGPIERVSAPADLLDGSRPGRLLSLAE
jgi:hypothetical protein